MISADRPRSRLRLAAGFAALGGALVAWIAPLWPIARQAVDYSALSPEQKHLFSDFHHTTGAAWNQLDDSEQIEFAGATQAVGDWYRFEPGAPYPQPGIDALVAVNRIHGAKPNTASKDQFNVEVKWQPGADGAFEGAYHWFYHIAIFHLGQYGYQEDKHWNPFYGLVTLFDRGNATQGQFHIDMRFWGHYWPDNGNVAANYRTYCSWYGALAGYLPCPGNRSRHNLLPRPGGPR